MIVECWHEWMLSLAATSKCPEPVAYVLHGVSTGTDYTLCVAHAAWHRAEFERLDLPYTIRSFGAAA